MPGHLLVHLHMRVAVDDGGPCGERGQVVYAVVEPRPKDVAVREEERAAILVDKLGLVCHAGEVEHHLVYLGVAVAAHSDEVALLG